MKVTSENISSIWVESVQKYNPFYIGSFLYLCLLFTACNKSNSVNQTTEAEAGSDCKSQPGKIIFGRNIHAIEYNSQNKPVKLLITAYNPGPPDVSVVTTYDIEYNPAGNPVKVSRLIAGNLQQYYLLEYNVNGQLIKQTEYTPQGVINVHTTAVYNNNGFLVKITSQIDDSTPEQSTTYEYANGNLVKKTIKNLYDTNSEEFYDVDVFYVYYEDKEAKVKPLFEGPLGLRFIADLVNSKSLHYLPDASSAQLFEFQESTGSKNMLKSIEAIAYRYHTQDTTNINYTYEYDGDGFPTLQKGASHDTTRLPITNPLGGTAIIISPNSYTIEKTIKYLCD